MENMLLVGLSRQMTLERQMDVVANNVANINTTGFKADRSLFQEYLMPVAHEDNFVGGDRRLSFVQDRATFHDFSQGPSEETKNPLDAAINATQPGATALNLDQAMSFARHAQAQAGRFLIIPTRAEPMREACW